MLGGNLLEFSAMTIILFTMVQATSGILQGAGKQKIPMLTLVAGVICKITLNAILVSRPEISIHGAPIASLTCYTVSMIPNLYYACKYTGCRLCFFIGFRMDRWAGRSVSYRQNEMNNGEADLWQDLEAPGEGPAI